MLRNFRSNSNPRSPSYRLLFLHDPSTETVTQWPADVIIRTGRELFDPSRMGVVLWGDGAYLDMTVKGLGLKNLLTSPESPLELLRPSPATFIYASKLF